jgi:hypothetical protein
MVAKQIVMQGVELGWELLNALALVALGFIHTGNNNFLLWPILLHRIQGDWPW